MAVGVGTDQKGEGNKGKHTNKQKQTKNGPGEKQKVRTDDPLVPTLRAAGSVGPQSQGSVMMLLTTRIQAVGPGGGMGHMTSGRRKNRLSVAPGPNKNSLTGGKWESVTVSMESSHLEREWGRDGG